MLLVFGMELNKNKYSAKEVEQIVNEEVAKVQKVVQEQKEKISHLLDCNRVLEIDLFTIKSKESLIEKAILDAEKHAQDKKDKTDKEYELTLLKLKNFSKKWDNYFNQLKEKYPLYPFVSEATELCDKINNLIGKYNKKEVIDTLENDLDNVIGNDFNPRKIMDNYVASVSENGFNLQDVLNPGELELEDICKELGLIEEE